MPGTGAYLVIGAIAAVVTFVTTPIVGRVARRMGWVVEPDERRVHTVATPDVGGIAMFIGFVAAFGAARLMDTFDPLFAQFTEPRGVLFAATVIFVVGFIDDVREISAPAKVMGTIVAGVVLVWYGVTMFYFRVPFLDVYILSDDWVPLITVIWLLGMTNAINLIDGLYGLAAGIVAIGAGAFFLYSQRLGDIPGMITQPNIGSLVAILTVGICIGFLPHNFNPARIFMGDVGALGIGTALALLAITTNTQLLIILICGINVMEAGSVAIQMGVFKASGRKKRLFRMSPIHHHFELVGWPETTVIIRFWIISGICTASALAIFIADFTRVTDNL